MEEDAAALAALVDAAAATLEMPLDAQQRAAAIVAFARFQAFALDVATVELDNEVEIAGVFVP
jgi:hypothetical protein